MKRLIAFTGKMGSGKSTAIELLKKKLDREVKLIKFAAPLYDMQNYIYERAGLTLKGPKDRKLLQWLGTDWGRSQNENLWVDIFERDVKHALESNPTLLVVCDDCRFDNEAEKIRELNGYIVRVVASNETRAKRINLENTGHSSEAGIDPNYIDYMLSNDGTIAGLDEQIQMLIEVYNL